MQTRFLFLLALGACFAIGGCKNSTDDKQTYSITFKQVGQTDVVKTIEKGETLSDIPTPANKTGYPVTWDKTDFSNVTDNIIVNAVETANTYTITYDANGGMIESTTQAVTYDAEYTLATPSKQDYFFLGWYNEGKLIIDGKWSIANDVTLVAQWEDKRPAYTVTFVQGNLSKSISVKKGEAVAESDIPALVEKTGYTVAWDKTDFSNIQENITITAIETPITYTATYDADGFAIDGGTVELQYDALCTALDMTLEREDYIFLGWEHAGITYTQDSVWKVAENVTLTANWAEKEQLVVTFKDTDGSEIKKTVRAGNTLTDIPTPKAKTGYAVDVENWYLDKECKSVATFENVQESVTVYAKATANTYTVTYNANGGIVADDTQDVTYDADYELYTPTHEKAYMRFDGWEDNNGNIIASKDKWIIPDDISLIARWTDTRETYTISFVQAGQEIKIFNVKAGENFTEVPNPIHKTGYTIVWDRTEFLSINENITVTAIETIQTLTISLNANGGVVGQPTVTVTYGQAYTIPKPSHGDTTKIFEGWSYDGVEIPLSGVWSIDAKDYNIELVAIWSSTPFWTPGH